MTIKVKDALKIGDFTKCTILSGASGLNKSISFVGAMEVPDIAPWLTKGQLLVTTGYSIRANPQVILKLIKDLHKASSAGLAIKTRFTGPIPQEAIELSDKLGVPLIEIPDNTAFIELINPLMQAISKDQEESIFSENMKIMENYFFIDLIVGNVKNEEEASYRASNLNWPKLPLQLVSFDVNSFEELTYINDEFQLLTIKENISNIICDILNTNNFQFTMIIKSDSFSCLIASNYSRDKLKSIIRQICESVNKKLSITLSVGSSKVIYKYIEIKDAYKDARDTIVISRIDKSPNISPFVSDVLLEQSLLNMEKNLYLDEFIDSSIRKLELYDKENKTQLLLTLEILIFTMGVKTEAAKNLFLHRNTLMYRIKKIESLIPYDLSNPYDLINLGIAIKLKPYLYKK